MYQGTEDLNDEPPKVPGSKGCTKRKGGKGRSGGWEE